MAWVVWPLRVLASLGSIVFLIAAIGFFVAGCIEMVSGRNAPGLLGGSYFYRRGWAREPQWSPIRWRKNGFFVVGFSFSAGIAAMILFLVAVGRLP